MSFLADARAPAGIPILGRSLDQVTSAYKHLWLTSILDLVVSGEEGASVDRVAIGMIRRAWHPVLLYRLSIGLQDQLADLVREIAAETGLPSGASSSALASLDGLEGDPRLKRITRYVPTRFLVPWLEERLPAERDREASIPALSNERWGCGAGCPYRILGSGAGRRIEIDPVWAGWLRSNAGVVSDFVRHRLCAYLQSRNPAVPGIVLKLEAPLSRSLEHARKAWTMHRQRRQERGGALIDIYSDRPIEGPLSIDHYLPWSFVVHDQLWNLVPTTGPLNSSKGDDLPHERFLPRLASAHHALIADLMEHPKLLADHGEFLGAAPAELVAMSSDALLHGYRSRIAPLEAIAGLQGFRQGWMPR